MSTTVVVIDHQQQLQQVKEKEQQVKSLNRVLDYGTVLILAIILAFFLLRAIVISKIEKKGD